MLLDPFELLAVRVTVYVPAREKVTRGFWAVNPVPPAQAPVPPKFQDQEVGWTVVGVLTERSKNPTVPPIEIAVAPVWPK